MHVDSRSVARQLAREIKQPGMGANQFGVLTAVIRDPWPGCGWTWGSASETVRILDSLVKRGLVEWTAPVDGGHRYYGTYRIAPHIRELFDERLTSARVP
jgi:hypothetical protein